MSAVSPVVQAPEEWHDKVDDPNVLVFDCRNEFESEVRPTPCFTPFTQT